ncbi:hypothetical protein [Reinekea marinisedimentorum]|uniref:Uncharacterized protein n=1 Tax=Reinekea marinisedimentorum TaxID=230495 RepID=A0A4R3ICW0_9GAMM|nr:hypothetical protein [Reinekea marinisedimentorum]TCS42465.1 hypothetical protein BCF53_103126 [Reinekea marinisedimentorum]
MDVENMDVFVERIRTILAAVHLSDTFSAEGFIDNLKRLISRFSVPGRVIPSQ